jgi:gliding motility associated protien GldN
MIKSISILSLSLSMAAGISCVAQTNQPASAAPVPLQVASKATVAGAQDAYILPWKTIKEQDIAWQKRVWRNIDVADAQNKAFVFDANSPKENDLAHIMIQGVFDGKCKAYSAENDRFTKELTKEELKALLVPGNDKAGFNPEAVAGYRIKEDWIYIKSESKVVVRIVGIAPLMEVTDKNGNKTTAAAFWVYYPDSRGHFAAHSTNADSKNWDVLFETRKFGSTIEKTIDVKKNTSEQE